jgi:hypothetical protein
MIDVEHFHGLSFLVDSIDDPVSSTPRAVTARQGPGKRFADAARAQGQGRVAELDDSGRYGFRPPSGDGSARGGLEPYLSIGLNLNQLSL